MDDMVVVLGFGAAVWSLVVPTLALYAAWTATQRQRSLELRFAALESRLAELARTPATAASLASVPASAAFSQAGRLEAMAPANAMLGATTAAPAEAAPGARRGEYVPLANAAPPAPELREAPEMPLAPTLPPADAIAPTLYVETAPAAAPQPDESTGAFRPVMTSELAISGQTLADAPPIEPRTLGRPGTIAAPGVEETRPERERPAGAAAAVAHDAPPPAAQPDKPASFEEQLGVTWLTRAGAGAFLLGALFFFKYAVENEWIGPWGREALGAGVGALLLGAGEYIRRTAKPRFVQALVGIGLAVLFVTVWASVAFYELVPRSLAFVANGALALLGAMLARRHKGAAILVLALVAAFLNPALLSTGDDRPIELFAYLLIVTTAVEVVAIELGFGFVPYLAMPGVAALFGGWWYAHGAAYRGSEGYAIPLGALGAFAVAWSGLAFLRGATRLAATPSAGQGRAPAAVRAAFALGLIELGATVVLFDEPVGLAAASIAVAVATSVIEVPLDRAAIGLAPITFTVPGVALAYAFASGVDRGALVGLLAAWALTLAAGPVVVGFARARAPTAGATTATSLGVLAAVPIGAFALLATGILNGLGHDAATPTAAAAVLACAAAVVVAIARLARTPAIAHASTAGTAVLLCVAAGSVETSSTAPFLGSAAAWAAVGSAPYLLVTSARRDGSPSEITVMIGPALATLGFALAAVIATGPGDGLLRAGLLSLAALFDGGLAAYAFAARKQRDAALGLGACAIALFAAAGSYALSGASVTVLWAVLAAGAAFVAGRTARAGWIALACALFFASLSRAFAIDVAATIEHTSTFLSSHGAQGYCAPPAFTNEGAVGVVACALALLVAARFTWRLGPRDAVDGRLASRSAAVLGYGLLAGALALEVRHATESCPPLPVMVTDEAWSDFLAAIDAAAQHHLAARTMTTTLVLAVFATALLAAGFARKSAFHRWLGLIGFLGTFAKLVLWDVWHVERVHQVVLLTGVGALLGLGGFLYARFGRRIVALLQGDEPKSEPRNAGP